MNRKGFTLIELLGAITILGVLLTIALPAINEYLGTSKKQLFLDEAIENQKMVNHELILGRFKAPLEKNEATIISTSLLETENNSFRSPYGFAFAENKSYVVIVNRGTVDDPEYDYYVAMQDLGRNALPLTKVEEIMEESFRKNAKNRMELTVQSFCGTKEGTIRTLYTIKGLEKIQPRNEEGYLEDWNTTIYSSEECGRLS